MLRTVLLLSCLMAIAVLGCDETKPTPPAPKPLPAPSLQASGAPLPSVEAPPRPPTGVLSEDDFMKLHQLRGDVAPAPKGTGVKLSNSGAYLSVPPAAKPPLPAVIVIHEWWGLNQHIRHWADRLAEDGYAALAVDLYGGKTATTPDEAMAMMKAVDAEAARATLIEAAKLLKDDSRIKAVRRGVIGWCFGGKWSLELALAAPDLDAAVVYYGHVETNPVRLASLEVPLLAIFGNQDEGIPPKMVDRFEFGLEQAGDKRYEIVRFDAKHAFANPSSARYDQKSAAAAWQRVRDFLRTHLREPPDGG